MKNTKTLIDTIFWFTIAATVGQLVWAILYMIIYHQNAYGSLPLNIIAYGLPVLLSVWACREWKKEQPRWHMEDNVLGGLLAASFVAMVVHVTVEAFLSDMINSYFNLPLIYTIPISIFALAWWMIRIKPTAETDRVGKILFALPPLAICAMIVHCSIACVIELFREPSSTSFPWWTMPLLIGLIYLGATLLLLIPYLVYTSIQKRKSAN